MIRLSLWTHPTLMAYAEQSVTGSQHDSLPPAHAVGIIVPSWHASVPWVGLWGLAVTGTHAACERGNNVVLAETAVGWSVAYVHELDKIVERIALGDTY